MEALLGRHVDMRAVRKIGEGTFGEAFKARRRSSFLPRAALIPTLLNVLRRVLLCSCDEHPCPARWCVGKWHSCDTHNHAVTSDYAAPACAHSTFMK